MKEFWNERYGEEGYAYGKEPNTFFKSVIDALPPGRILVPGAGEGRDAVYAATLGWQVDAFDYSDSGKAKALALAVEQGVSINYTVEDAADFSAAAGTYDLIVMVFFHLPAALRSAFNSRLHQYLAPGGKVVAEVFTPRQLAFQSGGPKALDLLPDGIQLQDDFADLNVLLSEEAEVVLSEGPYHQGPAAVLRFIGQKK
ncbi:MAG: class I SAM-dependent methyltransferase [Lewinellaceae bacterium]|nr:class I SAM-dependent methyltransferase [Lewinellaceae bacterium]